MSKLEKLREIIDTALQGAGKSNLSDNVINSVGGYISPNNRHLLNNLGAISTHYYEIGSHVGSSLISTVYGNGNLKSAAGCDNFSLFDEGHNAKNDFIKHCEEFIPHRYKLIEKDCFTVTTKDLPNKIDLYFYDGGHSEEETRKGITYVVPFLADDAIIIVDDFMWPEPQKGTWDGIRESGLKIEFAVTLDNGVRSSCAHNGWWNGLFIAYVKK